MIVSRAVDLKPLISKHFVLVLQNPPRRVDCDWPADRRLCLQADSDEPTPHDLSVSFSDPQHLDPGHDRGPTEMDDRGLGPVAVKAAQLSISVPVLLGRRVATVLAYKVHYVGP